MSEKSYSEQYLQGYYGIPDGKMYAQTTAWHQGRQMREDHFNPPQHQQVHLPSFSSGSSGGFSFDWGVHAPLMLAFAEFTAIFGMGAFALWMGVLKPLAAGLEWAPFALAAFVPLFAHLAMRRWRKKRIDRIFWNITLSLLWPAAAYAVLPNLLVLLPAYALGYFFHHRCAHVS